MSDQISVRAVVKADVSALADLLGQLRYEVQEDELERRLEQVMAAPDHMAFVGHVDETIRGFIHVYGRPAFEKPPQAVIQAIAVDAPARRNGIGKRLIAAAEQWARDQGYGSVTLHASTDRAGAHAFYTALGYHRAATSVLFRRSFAPKPLIAGKYPND